MNTEPENAEPTSTEPDSVEPTDAEPLSAEDASEAVRAVLADTVAELRSVGAKDEALGEVRVPRGIGPFKKSPSIVPVGRAWRLGVLLLAADGALFRAGRVTRATDTGRPQGLSQNVEQRRAERQAASRGRFATGEVVNFEFEVVPTDPEALATVGTVLSVDGARVMVRWNASGDRRELSEYLRDHLMLLRDE